MQALAIRIQSFADLCNRGCPYLDKTRMIERLINREKTFLLSRLRRFGKSLIVSTLQAPFERRKDLFEDLYIADKVNWEKYYPLIKLDWINITHHSREAPEESPVTYMRKLAASYQI